MIESLPLSASFLNPNAIHKRRRSMYASLFDRLGQGREQNLSDDQKEGLARQGLLNLGIGMLQTKGQGFGGALGQGLQSGLLSMNQGVEDIGNQRYKDEILARTRQGMERNTALEQAQVGLLNPDGSLNQEKFGEFAQNFPMEALDIKTKATPKPQNDWTLGQIGDGEGGTLDVWVNKDTRELRDLTGNPIGGDGFLAGATVDAPQQPATGLLGADMLPQLEQAVMQVESGGNPNAVSPKGAVGTMQTMPGTLRDPGYGVAPARDNSPAELERVGKDYLAAMMNQYGDPRLALAAYNWGPGNVDAILKQGGTAEDVLSQAPRETREYVPKVLGQLPGGAVPSPMQSRLGRRPAKGQKQDERYRTLSAEQVRALGLPEGTVAQESPSGQVQIINKPRDLPTGGQVVDNGDGTTTFIPAGKLTEGERNAAGFYNRMVNSSSELANLINGGYDPTNAGDRFGAALDDTPLIGGILAPAGRAITSPQGQQYQQAAMNWIRANLRKESGAAIGVKEANDEYRNYFPVMGDSKEVIAQKARNRQIVEQAMRSAAGGALPPPTRQAAAPTKAGGWSIQRVD
jgi:hypothetical protein